MGILNLMGSFFRGNRVISFVAFITYYKYTTHTTLKVLHVDIVKKLYKLNRELLLINF